MKFGKEGDKVKKAIITFIVSDIFEATIPDEVYEKENVSKAVEIAQKQMLEELGYTCTEYDDVEIEFVNEGD